MLFNRIRFIVVGLILSFYLIVDAFHFTEYYEVSYYLFITCISFLGLFYITESYVRLIFLYLFVESATNTYLSITDSYFLELQILYSICLLIFLTLNFYQKSACKKIPLRRDTVYKIYKKSDRMSFLSFLLSLFIGYPIVSYYCNGVVYYYNKKSRLFEKKQKVYSSSVYASPCKDIEKKLYILNKRLNTKYNLFSNNCII